MAAELRSKLVPLSPPWVQDKKLIGIFCPASAITIDSSRLSDLDLRLRQAGFSGRLHENCFFRDLLGNAGSPKERAAAFNDLILDERIGAVVSFWGGQDTIQILPHIDYEYFAQNPRWVCGYSDSGVMLQALSEKTGIKTLYGLGGVSLTKPNYHSISWDSYVRLISGPCEYCPPIVAGSPWQSPMEQGSDLQIATTAPAVIRTGRCEGLSLVCSIAALSLLLGTPYEPCFDGRVLFLEMSEDYDAKTLCRFLAQLDLCGVFCRVSGVVFAKFTSNSQINKEVFSYLIDTHIRRPVPIIVGLDFGHTDPIITLPNLTYVCLDTSLQRPITFTH